MRSRYILLVTQDLECGGYWFDRAHRMVDFARAIDEPLLEMISTFFFSSRRRHTRCGRDWSSDVCSSDLIVIYRVAIRIRRRVLRAVVVSYRVPVLDGGRRGDGSRSSLHGLRAQLSAPLD